MSDSSLKIKVHKLEQVAKDVPSLVPQMSEDSTSRKYVEDALESSKSNLISLKDRADESDETTDPAQRSGKSQSPRRGKKPEFRALRSKSVLPQMLARDLTKMYSNEQKIDKFGRRRMTMIDGKSVIPEEDESSPNATEFQSHLKNVIRYNPSLSSSSDSSSSSSDWLLKFSSEEMDSLSQGSNMPS